MAVTRFIIGQSRIRKDWNMKYATNITERIPLGAFQDLLLFFSGDLSRFLNDVFAIMVFV